LKKGTSLRSAISKVTNLNKLKKIHIPCKEQKNSMVSFVKQKSFFQYTPKIFRLRRARMLEGDGESTSPTQKKQISHR
jgi:hypothetical protein